MNQKTPCIVYMRSRLDQARANHFARKQQVAAEEALGNRGFEIVGRYGDEEFAPPFSGHLEPRPAWQMALDAAAERCITQGNCSLIVLRSDGIGNGDLFLPDRQLLVDYERVDIRVAELSLRGHSTDTSLAAAHRYFATFLKAERTKYAADVIELGRSVDQHDIILRRDPFRQIVRAYFANRGEDLARVKWQNYRKTSDSFARWPRAVDWTDLKIPPRSAVHLHSFVQGNPLNEVHWWRFKTGDKRETKVGNRIITPLDLAAYSLQVAWYSYEPEPLGPDDFYWEPAPRMETDRLVFRNWREDDLPQYESICNSPDAMRFLGGQLNTQEVRDDLNYFRELGLSGPTYWAVERKIDGQLIGFCGILVVEEDNTSVSGEWEIGWRFASSAQGSGLALEAAIAVVRAAFEEWSLSRIVCRVHSLNAASRRLANRLGFRICPGHETDASADGNVLYELTAQMYFQRIRGRAALE